MGNVKQKKLGSHLYTYKLFRAFLFIMKGNRVQWLRLKCSYVDAREFFYGYYC